MVPAVRPSHDLEEFRAGGGRVAVTGLRPHTASILHITGLAAAFDLPAGDAGDR